MALDGYSCSLDEQSLRKAKDELNEEPGKREKALATFREWIEKQSSWLKSPLDAKFLLAFLRKSEFSLHVAQEKLANYLRDKTTYPQYFRDVDLSDPKLMKILKSGESYVLPKLDRHGRRIVVYRDDRLKEFMDDDEYTAADVLKVRMAMHDYLLMDEYFQVNGLVWFNDLSRVPWDVLNYMREDETQAIGCVARYPIHVHGGHFARPVGRVLEDVMALFSMADVKTRKKIRYNSSMADVYKDIGEGCLPLEYLPVGYVGENGGIEQDAIDSTYHAMTSPDVVAWLKKLSSGDYGVDASKRPGVLSGLVKETIADMFLTSMQG